MGTEEKGGEKRNRKREGGRRKERKGGEGEGRERRGKGEGRERRGNGRERGKRAMAYHFRNNMLNEYKTGLKKVLINTMYKQAIHRSAGANKGCQKLKVPQQRGPLSTIATN